jgi:DNA polymerase III epsilon subunit-like protein
MKVLVFDTETTGLPQRDEKGKSPSLYDTTKWPYIIQFSYILYDIDKNKILVNHDHVIKLAKHVVISPESTAIHGISREKSEREGIPLEEALELFHISMMNADIVIAHNLSFDKQVVIVECIRHKRAAPFKFKMPEQYFCTMKNTVDLCKIEAISKKDGKKFLKYPTLSELHNKMFGVIPENTHNSLVDILVCLRCFIQMVYDVDICEKNRTFRSLFRGICPK